MVVGIHRNIIMKDTSLGILMLLPIGCSVISGHTRIRAFVAIRRRYAMNFQKCLYCGGNIEEGTFRSGGGNYFLPKGEKPPSLYSKSAMSKKRAVLLPPEIFSVGNHQWPAAFLCRNCKIIIIPYE